jgi:hypothetical protein
LSQWLRENLAAAAIYVRIRDTSVGIGPAIESFQF